MEKRKQCPDCMEMVHVKAKRCPYCRCNIELKEYNARYYPVAWTIVGFMFAAVAIYFIIVILQAP